MIAGVVADVPDGRGCVDAEVAGDEQDDRSQTCGWRKWPWLDESFLVPPLGPYTRWQIAGRWLEEELLDKSTRMVNRLRLQAVLLSALHEFTDGAAELAPPVAQKIWLRPHVAFIGLRLQGGGAAMQTVAW